MDEYTAYRCPKCKISFACQRRKGMRCFVCKVKVLEIRSKDLRGE